MSTEHKPWFNSWPHGVPKSIEYLRIPLHALLTNTAKKHPEKAALAFFERELSYRELEMLSNQFASALITLSVKKGDRVAIFLPNIPQFVIAYFGVLKVGAVATAISPLHKEEPICPRPWRTSIPTTVHFLSRLEFPSILRIPATIQLGSI